MLLIGKDIPEGLHLALTFDELPAIFDAQDDMWIEFTDGCGGDSYTWQKSIIEATCTALGIMVAHNEEGEEVTVTQFLGDYLGDIGDR